MNRPLWEIMRFLGYAGMEFGIGHFAVDNLSVFILLIPFAFVTITSFIKPKP